MVPAGRPEPAVSPARRQSACNSTAHSALVFRRCTRGSVMRHGESWYAPDWCANPGKATCPGGLQPAAWSRKFRCRASVPFAGLGRTSRQAAPSACAADAGARWQLWLAICFALMETRFAGVAVSEWWRNSSARRLSRLGSQRILGEQYGHRQSFCRPL